MSLKKVHFSTLGCPKNEVDTEVMAHQVLQAGAQLFRHLHPQGRARQRARDRGRDLEEHDRQFGDDQEICRRQRRAIRSGLWRRGGGGGDAGDQVDRLAIAGGRQGEGVARHRRHSEAVTGWP